MKKDLDYNPNGPHKPDPPPISLEELRSERDEDAIFMSKVLDYILVDHAKKVYKDEDCNQYGLEGCIESVEKLYESGWIKPIFGEEEVRIGRWNTWLGEYE